MMKPGLALWILSFLLGIPLLGGASGGTAQAAETFTCTWDTPQQLEEPTRDRFIDARSQPGSVCLRRWVLLADEVGDYASGGWVEGLSGNLRARKDFFIDDPNVSSATLYFYGNIFGKTEPRQLLVNGHPVDYEVTAKDAYRDYFQMQWDWAHIPVEYLRQGTNSFVLRDVGLRMEPSRYPNHSAKSEDGGATWNYDGLGPQNALDGEYIVRLGLERYAPQGEVTSPYVDLGALAGKEVAPEATVRTVRLQWGGSTPPGTGVAVQARIGSTPSFHGDRWTAWMDAGTLPLDKAPAEGWHYLQWRAILSTKDPKQTPVLDWVKLEADVEILRSVQNDGGVRVVRFENEKIIRSSYPFAYESTGSDSGGGDVGRFAKLYRIPELVQNCKTDFEKAVLLRKWTRKQWEYGVDPPDPIYNGNAPWDPAVLLYLARQGYSPGYCVHVSLAYTGVCAAAGLTARQFIRADGSTEVWSNLHKKWVVMEVVPEPTFYYERNGVPLSGLEIHQLKAQRAGFDVISITDPRMPQDTLVFFGSLPSSGGSWRMGGFFKPGDVRGLFDGVFIPLRNNWITCDEPAEAYHGGGYHEYDNYLWWAGDDAAPDVPWYSFRTDRVADMYWTLNQAELHPRVGAEPNTIQVDMATVTPNLDAFLVRVDAGDWVKVAPNALRTPHEGTATFPWALHAGKNTLEATTRNKFNLDGIVSALEVEVAS